MKKTVGISWISPAAWGALVLLSGFLLSTCEALWVGGQYPGRGGGTSFISVWNVKDATGATNFNKIELPLVSPNEGGNYNFTVDWGDKSEKVKITGRDEAAADGAFKRIHTYRNPGKYTVTIIGTFEGWRFIEDLSRPAATLLNSDNIGDAPKLIGITQWGNMKLGNNIDSHFAGAANLETFPPRAAPRPDLTGKTSLKNAFHNASSFNGDLSNWDVSSVKNMSGMFQGATNFNNGATVDEPNRPLTWNDKVQNVEDMSYMFAEAEAFNQDISGWNVGKVRNMSGMFNGAEKFNQDISGWNVGMITDMSAMFYAASAFNNGGVALDWNNIGEHTSVTEIDMNNMFQTASTFNQNISGWNVSKVTDMGRMFQNASTFNQDISSWDVSMVTNYGYIFSGVSIENSYKPTFSTTP